MIDQDFIDKLSTALRMSGIAPLTQITEVIDQECTLNSREEVERLRTIDLLSAMWKKMDAFEPVPGEWIEELNQIIRIK